MHHYGAGTNVGNVRDNNEDSYVCDEEKNLWIVADGMGGLGFGEVASAITTLAVTSQIRQGHGVNQAIETAHREIKNYAETDGLGTNMGTTIVLLLSHGSLYNIFWVGDSRAYMFDKGKLDQITIDHSLVQSLIEQGELTKEEAEFDPRKNAVTRALGVQELETVRADSISERWQPGQKIMLCSDGLTDCVRDHKIEEIMNAGGTDQETVDKLIEAALEGGGKDNVTVIVISAPTATDSVDSDTHVPDEFPGDETLIPRNDDTQRRNQGDEPTAQSNVHQMNLELPASSISEDVKSDAVTSGDIAPESSESETGWFRRISAAAVAAFFLAIAVSFQMEEPTAEISDIFTEQGPEKVQLLTRDLPDIDFSPLGQSLQVGLFSELAGAESRQTELASIGLSPHIEKRVSSETVHYAVIIGPLNQTAHAATMATLKASDHQYFHVRRDS